MFRFVVTLGRQWTPVLVGAVLFLAGVAKSVESQEAIHSLGWILWHPAAPTVLVALVTIEVGLGAVLMDRVALEWAHRGCTPTIFTEPCCVANP